jgi:ribosomal protein S12 methylthiotransferase
MHRPNNLERVEQLVADLRSAMPNVALRTTFIVGYPGETESEFEHLLDFMERQAFDKVGVFTYSREQGTAAASLPNQVPEEVKQERFDRAMTLQQGISLARNRQQVGRIMDVLVEGYGDGISVARSYRDAPEIDGYVILDGIHAANQFLRARITQAMEYDLVGEAIDL